MEISPFAWISELGTDYSSPLHQYEMNPLDDSLDGLNFQSFSSEIAQKMSWSNIEASHVGEERPAKHIKIKSWNSCTTEHSTPKKSPSSSQSQIISFENSASFPAIPHPSFPSLGSYDLQETMKRATRSPLQAQDHIIAERKRREKISQCFVDLSVLLPGLKKGTDYSSFFHQYQINPLDYYSLHEINFQSFSSERYNKSTQNRSDSNVGSSDHIDIVRPVKQLMTNSWDSCTTEHSTPKTSPSCSYQIISFGNSTSLPAISLPGSDEKYDVIPKTEEGTPGNISFPSLMTCQGYSSTQVTRRDASTTRRNILQAQDHVISERKRREKLSHRFIALSALIPGLKKMDKASVLGETIKYLKQLQERVKILEEQTSKKTMKSMIIVNKSHMASDGETISSDDDNFDNQCYQLYLPHVEARVLDKYVLIRIHCENEKGYLVNILSEIQKLPLTILNSNALTFGNSALDITVIAQLKTNSWNSCTSTHEPSPSSSSQIISFDNSTGTSSTLAISPPVYGHQDYASVIPKTEAGSPGNINLLPSLISYPQEMSQPRIASTTRTTLQAQDHVIAERKRREKLSQHFISLSALLPGLKKTDKASVLGDAIKYLQKLQERVKTLEEQTAQKTMESMIIVKKSHMMICSDDDETSSSDENFDSKLYLPHIEARVSDRDVLIRIHCENHKGCIVNILNEIEKLPLNVVNSNALPFGNSTLDVTVVAQMDVGLAITVKDLVNNLRQALLKFM
ncbi:hypothetical protein Ddye_009758 [Dipteronia dyeriana]|uniref:BHLH domain-containing protein n=1 Tax=Dipteronia dyeriana TaxID=168575 RepID=A0AAD9XCL6_9ROSI|nr:hypothetical protein Ddye_009758 [Dipteronia dyeriana]